MNVIRESTHVFPVIQEDCCLKNFTLQPVGLLMYFLCSENFNIAYVLLPENPYIEHVSPSVVNVNEGDSAKLEFKIAIQSNGNNWRKDGITFTFLSSHQLRTTEKHVQFTVTNKDLPQNWVYHIDDAYRTHEGVYSAHVSCKSVHSWWTDPMDSSTVSSISLFE